MKDLACAIRDCEVDQLVKIFRELVSRIAEVMSLGPDYSIGRAFDFAETKKVW